MGKCSIFGSLTRATLFQSAHHNWWWPSLPRVSSILSLQQVSEYLLLLILLLSSCFCRIISTDDEILAAKHTHTHRAQIWEAWSCSGNFLRIFPCFKKVVLKFSKKIFLLQEVGLELFLEFFLLELLELNHGFLFCCLKILCSLGLVCKT